MKTSYDVQLEAEDERLRLAASKAGFGANILSAGFGETKRPGSSLGVTLGAS